MLFGRTNSGHAKRKQFCRTNSGHAKRKQFCRTNSGHITGNKKMLFGRTNSGHAKRKQNTGKYRQTRRAHRHQFQG